ncbi:MAG: thiamine pyrophosphate-binding protein [Paracoccaceae bacterium]|nr:thiamine pyrophosphate-binding protein [Paracoccaceae bacterium]MDG1972522.1 thiamine pyrophosphate-binding protein [Paracoccaceae bacterium]
MSNQSTGAEAMVRLLEGHGVRHIFGLCGDTSLPFYDALARLDHGMTHILSRDERHAAYMADAYARVTGKPGICEGPSGGGATYILPGLVEANESSVPIMAITTDVATTSAGRFPLTELDQDALMRPLTKWNGVIPSAQLLPRMVRRAFREMTSSRPGSTHLGLPFDVQKDPVAEDDIWSDDRFGSYPALPSAPAPDDVERVLDTLLTARRPVIICGGGVVLAGACDALAEFAETLGIPVCTTVSGQGALAESHPLCVGVVGSNGGQPATRQLVDEADCVFFIGCRAGSVTTERWSSPTKGATILHLDNDPAVIGACYPTKAAIVADAGMALVDLSLALEDRTFTKLNGEERVIKVKKAKWAAFNALAGSNDAPILPERVIADLRAALPDDAIICADPGTPCPYFSAWYDWPKAGRQFLTNRAHGALGWALGASIGAQIGRPNAKVICAMGDGSFGMSVGELETVKRLGLPITFIVFSNSVFGWIKAGQKTGFDERYYSVDFTRTDHRAVAEAYGLKAWTVEAAEDLSATLAKAIAHDGPTLVDVIAQPLQDAAAPVSEWVS